jgi:hypothetical protein
MEGEKAMLESIFLKQYAQPVLNKTLIGLWF